MQTRQNLQSILKMAGKPWVNILKNEVDMTSNAFDWPDLNGAIEVKIEEPIPTM